MPVERLGTQGPVATPATPTTPAPAVPPQPEAPAAPATPDGQAQTTPAGAPVSSPGKQPQKPHDVFAAKPRPLAPQPNLAAPKSLGSFGGVNVIAGQDGTLGLGQVPTSLTEQIRAVQVAVLSAPDNQPLAAVGDVATLKTIAVAAAKLFEACLRPPRTDAEALELRVGRAGALGLMEAAARRAGALGDLTSRDQLTLGLLYSIGREPHRGLKAFAYDSTLGRAAKGELPATKDAKSALYPEGPPYAKWAKDGVIRVVHYADDKGSPRDGNIDEYVARGYRRVDNPDGSTTMVREAGAKKNTTKLRVEVIIPPAPTTDAPPSIFERMGDDAVDVIIYAGHAGYGKRVDDALAKGVQGTGDGKLIMLMQCYGEGSIESINRAFPDAHLISTREATDDNYDFTLMETLWKAVDQRHKYATVMKEASTAFKALVDGIVPAADGTVGELTQRDIDNYRAHPVEAHYFMPSQREVFLNKLDRDQDGVLDKDDTAFNVVFPKRIDGTGGYDPLDPGAPLFGLNGTALNHATNQLNLLMARYGALPDGLLGGRLPWNPDVFTPAGFFEGEPGDLRAFRFEVDSAQGRIKVSVNSRFAHAGNDALGRMLAVEAGAFVAREAGLDPLKATALQLSFLERMLHQEDLLLTQPFAPGSDAARLEYAFLARYGLPLSFSQLMAASGNPDDFVPATFDALLAKVQATPGLDALAALPLSVVGKALDVPLQAPLLNGKLDAELAKVVLQQLGVTEQLDEDHFSTLWFSNTGEPQPKRAVLPMKDAAGNAFIIALGIDTEGVLRSAVRLATT